VIPFAMTPLIQSLATIPRCILVDETAITETIGMTKEHISQWFDTSYPGKKNRNGWYFQQLLKLYAGMAIPGILGNYLVVDADVFFLRPVSFFSTENNCIKPLFALGNENHAPYFEHMQKLHPLFKKMTDGKMSGICHHMMFETTKVKEMMQMVEDYHSNAYPFWKIWLESVSEHLKYPLDYEESGASEYELYFHFMLQFHRNKVDIRALKWSNQKKDILLDQQTDDYISICHWL